nr:hypothetical protein [Mycoplasmopsis bovis]
MIKKGKVKGSKDFTYFTLVTYIPKSQFITDHTKEICETIFEDFLENVPTWEILVADKGFRTKAITEL